MIDEVIRLREEVSMQIKALKGLKEMAASYGLISASLLRMHVRLCSGSTSATSVL